MGTDPLPPWEESEAPMHPLRTVATLINRRIAMTDRHGMRYVWFDRVVVVRSPTGLSCECIVDDKRVPLPVAILHPDCRLEKAGDTGRLGVPEFWAKEFGLIPES